MLWTIFYWEIGFLRIKQKKKNIKEIKCNGTYESPCGPV